MRSTIWPHKESVIDCRCWKQSRKAFSEQEAIEQGCEGAVELARIKVCKGREGALGREEARAEPGTLEKHPQFVTDTQGANLGGIQKSKWG